MCKALAFIAVLAVLAFPCIDAVAQSPYDKPEEKQLHVLFLEHLIKIQIDSVRKAHGLRTLVNDSLLYIAAQDHAIYLSGEKTISHFQRNKQKHTPQNRADFYGAQNYYVGENVLSYPLDKTYLSTAQTMVRGWVNSPGHYKNIITPDYQITGLAIARHPVSGNIIAVQKFAKVLWKYAFRENKQMFVYSTDSIQEYDISIRQSGAGRDKEKLPWGLKPLDGKSNRVCTKCAGILSRNFTIRPQYDAGNIYAVSLTAKEVLKTFKRRNDGLAVEQIAYEPYHCGNPAYYTNRARRNQNSSIDGEVFEPVYKKDLLRSLKKEKRNFYKEKRQKIEQLKKVLTEEAKKELEELKKSEWEPGYWSAFMMKLPTTGQGYHTYNLLLIHDGAIHLPLYFTGACGDLTFTDTIPMKTDFSKPNLAIQPRRKRFDFEVPFGRNSRVPDSLSMRIIEEAIRAYRVDTIRIDAFSSVEGSQNRNSTLHTDRASVIYSHVKPYTDGNTVRQIRAIENWALFYKQLDHTAFGHWKEWEPANVREELKKQAVFQEWETRLAEQRKAKVTIYAHNLVSDTLAYLYTHYRGQNPAEATVMQNYLYSVWQQRRIPADSILSIRYPLHQEYSSLIANQMAFNYQVHALQWKKPELNRFLHSFQEAITMPKAGNILKYNYLVFVVNNWHTLQNEKGISAEKIYTLLSQLEKSGGYKTELPKVKALFYVNTLPGYMSAKNVKRVKEGLKVVFHFYKNQPEIGLHKERTLSLAKYFIELGTEDYAYTILEKYQHSAAFDAEVYAYYLKLAFVHPFYQHNRAYSRLLISARQQLSKEQWCDLFVGPCNINFPIFDDEVLRNLYCATCADRGNYATSNVK